MSYNKAFSKLVLLNPSDGLEPGTALLFTILFIVVGAALIVFLYFRIKGERNRYLAEKMKVNVVDKKTFDHMLNRKIRAAKNSSRFSFLLIRIREGKDLINSLGEKQYSAVLGELKERFYSVLPRETKICLYKEDLYAAIIDEDLNGKTVSELAGFCIEEGERQIVLSTGVKISAGLSIGAVIYDHSKKMSAEEFFAHAEQALVVAERNGKNGFCIYSAEIEFEDDETAQFYRDVKFGIERNEFFLRYQPIKSADGELVAYESLLRWRHPKYGVIKAERFIPVLLRSGYMNRVGEEMFTKLCLAVNKYERKSKTEKPILFSMNFSCVQTLISSFAEDLYREVRKRRLNPGQLVMEVSHTGSSEANENFSKLKEYGFRLAIDGFDLSDSNALNEMEKLAPDWIKLPISFLRTCKTDFFSRGVTEMIVKYAKEKGAKIVVTGVEKKEDVELSEELKIGYLQGNYLSEEVDEDNL